MVANLHVAAVVAQDITFLHTVRPGPSLKSYGVHVAKLAGFPDDVVAAAEASKSKYCGC